MRLWGPKKRNEAGTGDRGDRPAESLHLGNNGSQRISDDVAHFLRVDLLASTSCCRKLSEKHADQTELLALVSRLGAEGPGTGRRKELWPGLIECWRDAQAELLERRSAASVSIDGESWSSLRLICPYKGTCGLFARQVMGEAGFPRTYNMGWRRTAIAAQPVPG